MGFLVMARAPQPGRVKTRLEPLLGPDGCAALQTELIRHTLDWVAGCARSLWLAFTPADADGQMAGLGPARTRRLVQRGDDLGHRMRAATDDVFRGWSAPLAMIGTDAPELGPVHAQFAEEALREGHDASLVPAIDGGYALLALARRAPWAFDLPAEAWGGPDVLELTVRALRRGGCSVAVLEPVRDLDTPDDARSIAADPRCPPAIRELLQPPSTR